MTTGTRVGTVRRSAVLVAAAVAAAAVVAACSGGGHPAASTSSRAASPAAAGTPTSPPPQAAAAAHLLPGMPPPTNPSNVYAADGPGDLSPVARHARPLIYVPETKSNDVRVIDPATYKVVERVPNAGVEIQHVIPSYDLKTLYAAGDNSNTLLEFDPRTGRPGRRIHVADPYNLYFTPDGRHAIVVAEALKRLDFYDPHTWRLQHSLPVPRCAGVDHMDFTADGRTLLASCEFASRMIVVDVARQAVLRTIPLSRVARGMPQDVKLSPDGRVFYVADMMANGVYEIDGTARRVVGFVPTGKGTHGLYVDRSGRRLFITNRGEGSVSVLDLATRTVVVTWRIPGGGSPDMGGVSADGRVLWLSGRYDGVVYAIRTTDGHLLAKIPVGSGPHGLCVWPQPGRYSLGHTGILR